MRSSRRWLCPLTLDLLGPKGGKPGAKKAERGDAAGEPKLSPAAAALATRLQQRTKKDPAKSVKLIDRLKDTQLNGYWAKAVALFDNYPAESRQWRWQSFHYRCLLQILTTAKQPEPLRRIWTEMMLRPEISLDVEGANDALALAATGTDAELVSEIEAAMRDRAYDFKQRALRALDRRREMDWEGALASITQRVELHTLEAPKGTPVPLEIQTNLQLLATKHRKNSGAALAIAKAIEAAGVTPGGDTYAAKIHAVNADWERALGILDVCRAASTPTVATYNEVLSSLAAGHQHQKMPAVAEAMSADAVPANKRTVELMLRHYEATGSWQQASDYFRDMKAAGVPPTNSAYTTLMRVYTKGGAEAKVMGVFDAMRKDGFQGGPKDTVSLINAWSSNRFNRYRRGR